MSYLALLGSVVVAGFLAASAGASLAVAAGWRLARLRDAVERAGLATPLRLLPAAAGAAASLVLGTAFLIFEPRDTREAVPEVLLAAVLLQAALVARGAFRAASLLRQAEGTVAEWCRRAAPIAGCPASRGDVLAVDGARGVVALAGIVRPRLFVSRDVMEALTPAELDAALAHEEAHRRGRDNLRSLALAALPDALSLMPAAAELDDAVRRARERSADASVAATGRGLDLAAAIVKVARLAAPGRPSPALASLHDGGPLASRVGALVDPPPARQGPWGIVSLAALVAGGSAALHPDLLLAAQDAVEVVVRLRLLDYHW